MKKLLSMYCILLTYAAHTQQLNLTNPWSSWGIGAIKNSSSLDIYEPYHIEGYQIYFPWSQLEPTKDNFNWNALDAQLNIVVNKNIWVAIQIMVGPDCPDWIYDNVPKVTTSGGNDNGPYPYYLDPDYKERYYNLIKQVAAHINRLPQNIKSKFMYWQICEGSTGDEQPYKGTVTDSRYAIDYYTWEDFRHAAWDTAAIYSGKGKDRLYRLLFNSGNFAQDLQYVDQHFPGDMHKDGLLSHQYSFEGEALYYARQYLELNKRGFDNRTRGEVQDIFNNDWWDIAPVKQAFALTCSAASGGLDMLNITPGYINSVFNDTRPTDFLKRYAGLRRAKEANVGFNALRDVPDFADTFRFPVSKYGPLIDPSRQNQYNNRVRNINSNPRDSSMYKYWLNMKAIVQFLNPSRRNMIVNEFKPAGAMFNSQGDEYHNDFGIRMTKNFLRFIRQWYPDSTSYGAWRIGPDSSIYGRYARLCRLRNNQGEMFFKFDDSLVDRNSSVQVTITYYDTGNGMWSINGSNRSLTVKNTGTRKWLQKTASIKSFQPLTLLGGRADISLRYISGTNTPFALIEMVATPPLRSDGPVAELENLDLKLSPNPNAGHFKVSFTAKKTEKYSVFVTDVSGNLFFTETRQGINGSNLWSISPNLKRGSYVLHVESGTVAGEAKFIVVQ